MKQLFKILLQILAVTITALVPVSIVSAAILEEIVAKDNRREA